MLNKSDKFIWAISDFSEKFGAFETSTKKGVAWGGKTAKGLQDQLDEIGYWLYLNKDCTVEIHDVYTFADDFPNWGIEYVVGYCKLHGLKCEYGES